MNENRPDRCVRYLLPADRPEEVPENGDLAADLLAGRPVVATWAVDVDTPKPKIVVVLGPVPRARSGAASQKPGALWYLGIGIGVLALLGAWLAQ